MSKLIGIPKPADIEYIAGELRRCGYATCAEAEAAGCIITKDQEARAKVDALLHEGGAHA